MRKACWLLALLATVAGTAWARQELAPTTDNGPMGIKAEPPKPGKDGIYAAGPGIVLPIMITRATVAYPDNATPDVVNGVCQLSVVIGADGVPTDIEVETSHGAAFDAAAIDAVKQSKFEPGTLDGTPVPVRVDVRTRFFGNKRPAIQRIVGQFGPRGRLMSLNGGNGFASQPGPPLPYDKPPVATYAPAAEFTEQARAAKFNGVVLVSALVTVDGMPTDIKVMKSAGMGLDEKAVESVSQYRFKPATKDGAPVAARITVEINFRIN